MDTNWAVQPQKMDRGLKFRILVVEELYYPYSENKGADQLCGYREADLRLCFRICKKPVFSRKGSNAIICSCFCKGLLKYENLSVFISLLYVWIDSKVREISKIFIYISSKTIKGSVFTHIGRKLLSSI